MSLSMLGHIDNTFKSVPALRTAYDTGTADGLPFKNATGVTPHTVNLQPATDDEIDSLNLGGERSIDIRKIYVNDGVTDYAKTDTWTFTSLAGYYNSIKIDNRPWRNYCKIFVSLADD